MEKDKSDDLLMSTSDFLDGERTYCTANIESPVRDDVRRMSPAWWLLPSAVLGCVVWVMIIRSAWSWLS